VTHLRPRCTRLPLAHALHDAAPNCRWPRSRDASTAQERPCSRLPVLDVSKVQGASLALDGAGGPAPIAPHAALATPALAHPRCTPYAHERLSSGLPSYSESVCSPARPWACVQSCAAARVRLAPACAPSSAVCKNSGAGGHTGDSLATVLPASLQLGGHATRIAACRAIVRRASSSTR
jgi:hypothetical protein